VISVEQLEFRYAEGEFFLRIPELSIGQGATVAFIGPSGSGKTTLLNLIAGIALPRSGRIVTKDVELTSLDDGARRNFRVRNIGLVFQEFELLEYLTVLDNILLPYRINPSMRLDSAVRDRARQLAESVDISDKLARYATKLSQGEKQRVAVCRALLPEPTLLLADEPTGNLDPNNKGRVLDILFDYAKRTGATLVTVTHDHELVSRFERVVDFREFHELVSATPQRGAEAGGSA
jgi:ABC-type lipoprotein export system ATPase subunit